MLKRTCKGNECLNLSFFDYNLISHFVTYRPFPGKQFDRCANHDMVLFYQWFFKRLKYIKCSIFKWFTSMLFLFKLFNKYISFLTLLRKSIIRRWVGTTKSTKYGQHSTQTVPQIEQFLNEWRKPFSLIAPKISFICWQTNLIL